MEIPALLYNLLIRSPPSLVLISCLPFFKAEERIATMSHHVLNGQNTDEEVFVPQRHLEAEEVGPLVQQMAADIRPKELFCLCPRAC